MPFFIPILVGIGIAAALSGSGAATIHANDRKKKARKRLKRSETEYTNQGQKTQDFQEQVNKAIESLGQDRIDAMRTIKEAITFLQQARLKNPNLIVDDLLKDLQELEKLGQIYDPILSKITTNAAGTAGGLAVGALASLGAYGLASTIGIASTGAAISGLSGAAASSAALAWLGGGALAAGGGGAALGANLILPGIAIIPTIAAWGILAEFQAGNFEKKVDDEVSRIRKEISELKLLHTKFDGIHQRTQEISRAVRELNQLLQEQLKTERQKEAAGQATKEEKYAGLQRIALLAKALRDTLDIPVINKNGEAATGPVRSPHHPNGSQASLPSAHPTRVESYQTTKTITRSGTGAAVPQVFTLNSGLAIIECEHRGEGTFQATLEPANKEAGDPAVTLADTEGSIKRQQLVMIQPHPAETAGKPFPKTYYLRVKASGKWTVTITQPRAGGSKAPTDWNGTTTPPHQPYFSAPFTIGSQPIALHHEQKNPSPLSVTAYPVDGRGEPIDIIRSVNQNGPASNLLLQPNTEYMLEVEAASDWSLTVVPPPQSKTLQAPDQKALRKALNAGRSVERRGTDSRKTTTTFHLIPGLALVTTKHEGAGQFKVVLRPNTAPNGHSTGATPQPTPVPHIVLIDKVGAADTNDLYVIMNEAPPAPPSKDTTEETSPTVRTQSIQTGPWPWKDYTLEVTADGPWKIKLSQPAAGLAKPCPGWQGEGMLPGRSVITEPVTFPSASRQLFLEHSGPGAFIVDAYPVDGSSPPVNLVRTKGKYAKRPETELKENLEYLLEIQAESDWKLKA